MEFSNSNGYYQEQQCNDNVTIGIITLICAILILGSQGKRFCKTIGTTTAARKFAGSNGTTSAEVCITTTGVET